MNATLRINVYVRGKGIPKNYKECINFGFFCGDDARSLFINY